MLLRHNPEIEVLEHLHDNAAKHADASGGLFYVDPFNPKNLEDYMWLAPSVRSHENMAATGNRIPADQLANIAPVVDRRISNLVSPEYLVTDPEHKIALSLAGEFLSNGYNVALGQSHNEPTDIALDLGVKSIWLEREGVKHSTAIILSKGFDFLKINTSNFTIDPGIVRTFLEGLGMTVDQNGLLPLRSFLGILADKSYFVIPDSASFSEIRKKQTEKIRKFNAAAIQLIQHDLRG